MMSRTHALLLLLFLFACTIELSAQVVEIDPPRPVIYSKKRTIEVLVTNPGTKAVDVALSFEYAVTRTDSLGEIQIVANDLTDEEKSRDCSNWLKVFPRRMVIPARGSRTVRVISTIPQGSADGEYWARFVLDCQLQDPTVVIPPLDTANADVAIGTSVSTMLVLPFVVRVGKFDTGISIETLTTRVDTAGKTLLLCDVKREGNSPYRGTLEARIKQASESEIAKLTTGITVEFNSRVPLKLPELTDGTYKVELNVVSVRGGSYSDVVIKAPPTARTYTMTVNGGAISFQPEN